MMTPEDKLSKGIILLQKPQPFFAYLLMHLKPRKIPENAGMKTVGVNAKGELFYYKDFVDRLSLSETIGVLCHEVLHVALLHPLRRGSRHKVIANVAQDIVVNMIVSRTALYDRSDVEMSLPDGTIPVDVSDDSSEFDIGDTHILIERVSEKNWEQIYDEIVEQLHKDGKSPQSQSREGIGFDEHFDGSGDGGNEQFSEQEVRALEQKWRSVLADAANYAKQQGKLPGGMDRIIDDILNPKVRWKQLLLQYIKPYINPVDWSYQKPHKKSKVVGVYMPNVRKERIDIEVVVDTSGSISSRELSEFLSEIVAIAKSMQYIRMWVTFVDAQVQRRYEVDNGDINKILSMKPSGGGGTDMEVALDFIKKNNRQVPCVVVLTDGYTSFNRSARDFPFDVIWVITKDGISGNVPYGFTVKMD